VHDPVWVEKVLGNFQNTPAGPGANRREAQPYEVAKRIEPIAIKKV
jgi:hypothetical protein